jgi:hypothetical protein
MLTLIEEILTAGKQQGFGLTRLWANMEWALNDLPGVHDIVEYETRLNYILPKYDDVVGGVLRENQFYAPPDEFLRELRDRRAPVS